MNIEKIKEKAKKIKLFVMDVDGTLTDGKVYYSANGEELKKFSIIDGMGIELLKKAGIEIGIITAEQSNIVKARASKLNIKYVILNSRNKKKALTDLASSLNLSLQEIAYIGDDINDLQVMQIVGLSGCPFDANSFIKDISDYQCKNVGGDGAVREFAELILTSQNKKITLNENW